jgi:flagellar basal-body rod protein FlgG
MNDPNILRTAQEVGPYGFGTHIDQIYTVYSEGNLEETGLKTDLAISGGGYFVVQTPNGERYNQSRQFLRQLPGYLQTGDGYLVLGEDGPLPSEEWRVLG